MSSPTSPSSAKPVTGSSRRPLRLMLALYLLVLLAVAFAIPLRIPEILQIAAIRNVSPAGFFTRLAEAPHPAPLNPILQSPFVLLGGPSRLPARLVSLAFAAASCYLFLRLAKRVPLARPYWALLLFMLLPVHFELSFEALPFEQALFLVVLATDFFFRLVFRQDVKNAVLYAGCLTLCLYTNRDSFLPALGYLVFLLRFVGRKQESRAMWYVLAATVPPIILFVPYALWARSHANPNWFSEAPSLTSPALFLRALRSLAAEHWASYTLFVLLVAGVAGGVFTTFSLSGGPIGKRIRLFVLAGGILSTIGIALALDLAASERFSASELLFTAPAIVLLLVSGLEWLWQRPTLRVFAVPAFAALVVACALADLQFVLFPEGSQPREDLQAVAAAIPSQLSSDSCVVFVSERLSRNMFLVFEPQLAARECQTFFHPRVILASHPYVAPDQQQDAESYFRGLDFVETKRLRLGQGQIVVEQQHGP